MEDTNSNWWQDAYDKDHKQLAIHEAQTGIEPVRLPPDKFDCKGRLRPDGKLSK